MSIDTDEMPPAIWFFRKDYLEMAELVIEAFKAAGGVHAVRADIVAALRRIDVDYDDTDLRRMTEAFLGELEDED
ncbi:MAG: hypothetical protein R3B94_09305 [Hyphomonas sp.]